MVKKSASSSATELGSLGEFGLIRHLTEKIKLSNASSLAGVGDDAAILKYESGIAVVSTDMLVEGVHFDLLYTPVKHLGYKAVVVNLSDIYAMNARPSQITVSIAASNRISVEFLEELYEGISLACKLYGVDLVGGDTTSSLSGLVISITALGSGEKDQLVYRNGARVNDLICVSGDLGAAYAGLQLLEREKKVYEEQPDIQPDLSGYDYPLERQLKPEARKKIIDLLAQLEILPTSMIDISDGLSSELMHLCSQSNVGCNIYEEKLPIDMVTLRLCEELGMMPTISALNGGEDYELLFTIDQKDYEKIRKHEEITVIGHITDEGSGTYLISRDEQAFELQAQGWDAMSSEKEA